jgi:selenocysteine lyase/cysteine desulfurase
MAAARAEFPLLEGYVYLNSNSTGATPRGVRRVLAEYWNTLAEWRDEVWERWWAELTAYATAIAALVGAPPDTVVTDVNLSSLLGRLLGALDYSRRPVVVTTDVEFPTVPFLLHAHARRGVEVRTVSTAGGTEPDVERLLRAIDERTRLVCVSHAAFTTGAMLDLAPIVRHAHDMGAWVVVDAYQSVGVVPIDVSALGVDFLLGGAHKWLCGSIESAFLYAHPSRIAEVEPLSTGWMASRDPLSFGPATEYASSARRFASGTPAVLPALVSRVALDMIADIGVASIRQRSLRLTSHVMARALNAHLEVLTPRAAEQRAGIVTLRFPGDEAAVAALKRRNLVCSYRGGVRIAPHFYNTEDEVERFMDALVELARRGAA